MANRLQLAVLWQQRWPLASSAFHPSMSFALIATPLTHSSLLPQDSEPITSLALSPDKHSLVAASRSLSVRLWDWTTGECRRTWKVRGTVAVHGGAAAPAAASAARATNQWQLQSALGQTRLSVDGSGLAGHNRKSSSCQQVQGRLWHKQQQLCRAALLYTFRH